MASYHVSVLYNTILKVLDVQIMVHSLMHAQNQKISIQVCPHIISVITLSSYA